jgi:lysophospholipase L1-like esterase
MSTPAPATSDRPAPRRRGRRLVLRALAIGIGLLPFVACEAVLRVVDWPRARAQDDPFVGFSQVHPLFVLDPSGQRYEIPPARYKFFGPESFQAVKPPGEFRIFCLGGSTVLGRPFAKETSYTTWLELSLKSADPSHPWRVINCGGVSYASYRLVEILREVLRHQPDLIILHTGHNEFLEDRTYQHLKQVPWLVRRPLELASRLRTFALLRKAVEALTSRRRGAEGTAAKPVLGPEVEARLDYEGGLAAYHEDPDWRRDVVDHFAFNLRRMVRMAQDAHVPVILVNPVYNLDTPPFKSEHWKGLSAAGRRRFEALWDEARAHYTDDLPRAIALLERAVAIDDHHAGVHYALAKCYQQAGRLDEARASFLEAKERDVCPLRSIEPINRAILDVGQDTGTPVVDLVPIFTERSRGGILGDDLLVDHVHPSIQGHQLIARVLVDELKREGVVTPRPGWEAERDRLYREQLASLDDFYYLRGQKQLGNLRLWAQGRGNRVRPLQPPRAKEGGAGVLPARRGRP